MCTVSIVPLADRVRVVCNRDELHTRADALPPDVMERAGVRAVAPLDPESGGTWIAGSEPGLVFAVLNVNRGNPGVCWRHDARSRGAIIPDLFGCLTLGEVTKAVALRRYHNHRPFRLVVADSDAVLELVPASGIARRQPLTKPLMFTSSGLGDHIVERPRRDLFERMMSENGTLADKQDRFHAHRWRFRPEISVEMHRVDARTVSRTTIELRADGVGIKYDALAVPQEEIGAIAAAIKQTGYDH